ncbi:MAG: hypothetical protein KKA73_04890 [Chloroflexi bacterium]|nr:hypothetical protein [Chloroflexota bacterium]MBU1747003.1 hypothetical protein [Chloroflexota bacterium]
MTEIVGVYANFEDLRNLLRSGAKDTMSAQHDDLLRQFCLDASRFIDRECRRTFYPRLATKYYAFPPHDAVLLVRDDLLEVESFTTQNGGVSVSASDYYLMCGERYDLQPYDRIVMKSDGNRPTLLFSGTPQRSQAVTGWWGYHEDWDNAWEDSGDTLQADVAAAATRLTVAGADQPDIWGVAPRFKEQALLRLDDELVYLVAREQSTALQVRRGVNGTTAATHTSGTVIYVYRPLGDIERACKRLAANLYRQRDKFGDELTALTELGQVAINRVVDASVRATIQRYERRQL